MDKATDDKINELFKESIRQRNERIRRRNMGRTVTYVPVVINPHQYDWLVANYPLFMSEKWPNMPKESSPEGFVLLNEADYQTVQEYLGR